MQRNPVSNKKFHPLVGAHQYVKIFQPIVNPMISRIQTTQISWNLQLVIDVMNNITFKMQTDLEYKIGVLFIALNKMIHFHFDHLLYMLFLDIIRDKVKNNTQRSNDKNAKSCQRYGNPVAQAIFTRESEHAMSNNNRDHARFLSDRIHPLWSMPAAVYAYGYAVCHWFLAHLPRPPFPVLRG